MQAYDYIIEKLIGIGFSEGEAIIYTKLLSYPSVTANFLQKQTRFSLAGIYKILDSLISSGLVLTQATKPSVYKAIGTNLLAKRFEKESKKMQRISRKLQDLTGLMSINEQTEIYEDEELVNEYLSIPKKINDFIWCVGSFEAVINFFGENTEREFIKTRCSRGVSADAIIFDSSKCSKELAGRDRGEKRETKFIGIKNYPLNFDYLFGDTYLNFHKDDEGKLRMLKVKSKNLANAKLMQYQALWNSTCK
ncbi:MAG: helix-turn-helix domain-containing protein [Candidatus Gracilibacteria bacterium]